MAYEYDKNDIQWLHIDLHIHSPFSLIRKKDESKIKDYLNQKNINYDDKLTLGKNEFISDLLQVIKNEKLNIISITDHNYFSYLLYKEIKEKLDHESVQCKIFPAVELDIILEELNSQKFMHFLVIFNDQLNDEEYKNLENILINKYSQPNKGFKLSEIIHELIGFDFILIPHGFAKCRGFEEKGLPKEAIIKYSNQIFINSYEMGSPIKANIMIEEIKDYWEKQLEDPSLTFVKFSDCHNLLEYTPIDGKTQELEKKWEHILKQYQSLMVSNFHC